MYTEWPSSDIECRLIVINYMLFYFKTSPSISKHHHDQTNLNCQFVLEKWKMCVPLETLYTMKENYYISYVNY